MGCYNIPLTNFKIFSHGVNIFRMETKVCTIQIHACPYHRIPSPRRLATTPLVYGPLFPTTNRPHHRKSELSPLQLLCRRSSGHAFLRISYAQRSFSFHAFTSRAIRPVGVHSQAVMTRSIRPMISPLAGTVTTLFGHRRYSRVGCAVVHSTSATIPPLVCLCRATDMFSRQGVAHHQLSPHGAFAQRDCGFSVRSYYVLTV